ncbi:MAG: glycoside hydrolase family 140 protein [Bacteroidales bacterium]|nr:glycoside hydrolase family 140 protein [Bacteroidales bacterium]
MKRGVLFILISCFFLALSGQLSTSPGQLKVSANGHYLQQEDGSPFFWLGDTGWELFHRLLLEEIQTYLENRREKGFNVIQAVILAEQNGLKTPNRYGDLPLINMDPTSPNEKYFQLVDTVIRMALSKNLYMGLLPAWGDKVTRLWGTGPVIFNTENAYQYGMWLGKRYNNFTNIIWILGGDRPPVQDSADWRPVWRAMAHGILEGTQNKAIIAYHPSGWLSTSRDLSQEDWLDINMMQSGHGSGHDVPVWEWIANDWNVIPAKPVLDAEPNYEDHPVNPWPTWNPANGYFRDYDVRKQTYRSVFAGACGVTYGNHSIWQFWNPKVEKINYAERYWTEALDRPGAFQMGYLKKLIESRPQFTRIPDQSVIIKGQGEKGEYITACRDSNGSYIFIYMPVGKTISVNTTSIKSGRVDCWWFNPKSGEIIPLGIKTRKEIMEFTPFTLGIESDWVLVLDDHIYRYPKP